MNAGELGIGLGKGLEAGLDKDWQPRREYCFIGIVGGEVVHVCRRIGILERAWDVEPCHASPPLAQACNWKL